MSYWDKQALSKTSKYFDEVIPTLESYFDGTIYKAEYTDNSICRLLDFDCAIDAILSTQDIICGLAHRCSYSNYNAFTVRLRDASGKPTEYDKIIREDSLKPYYHIQTIVIDDKPNKIAIAKTDDLVKCIQHYMCTQHVAKSSGDTFASIPWNLMSRHNLLVDIIDL